MRLLALAVALCAGVAAAEPPADAPLTVEVQRAQLLTINGEWLYPGPGVYQNATAAKNTATYIQTLEQDHFGAREVALVVGGALVLGFVVGAATAHFMPSK